MLSKNLKYLRLKNGYSQEFIAERLGYKTYTTIQKWESGVSEPPISKLKELSDIYNVDMDTMYRKDLELKTQTWDADDPNIKEKILNTVDFKSAKEAVQFILAQPAMASYGGYTVEDMTDEEILDMANDMLLAMKLSLERNK